MDLNEYYASTSVPWIYKNHFPATTEGFKDADAYLLSLGEEGQRILQGEQSTDGWTQWALANSIWHRRNPQGDTK